jgi:Bacteriocin-protection, YdeI or OmpD-Associated
MDNKLGKKLLIKPGKSVMVLHAPTGFEINTSVGLNKPFDVAIVFVKSKAEIDKQCDQAIKVVKEDGVLWFAYPKLSSSIKTDISRDTSWDALRKQKYEPVTQIAIDETWSALRFKPVDKIPKMIRQTSMAKQSKDLKERVLDLPSELQHLLNKNPKAKKFFDSLSFTNRKEYAVWISSAKRPETKERRVNDTLVKLLSNKKNLSGK